MRVQPLRRTAGRHRRTRMGLLAFALAGALGGLAGVLIAPSNALSFYSDLPLALSGFAAAVFGGLTSPASHAGRRARPGRRQAS